MESKYEPVHINTRRLLLNFCGLKPPTSFLSSFWKTFLYNIYIFLGIFSHLPFFTFQIMGLFAYSDNIQVVSGLIFQMTVCFDGFIIMFYYTFRRQYLWQIFSSIDNKFDHYYRLIGIPEKRNKILNEASRTSNKFTNLLVIIFLIVMAAWCVTPCFVKYFTHDYNEVPNSTKSSVHFEYFVIAMWLPENALQFPMYEIIYFWQFFYVWTLLTNFTVGNLVFSSVFYDISAQFKVLTSAIEDMDSFIQTPLNKNIGLNNENNVNNAINESRMELKISTRLEKEDLYNGDYKVTDISNYLEDLPIASVSDETREINYMVNCIKFHQEILEFCNEVDRFLSPLLLIYFILYEIMICVPLFQLVLGQAGDIFRFTTSAVDATALPLSICLCGQILSNESMGVQKAAYGCQWYHRSEKLKKLLKVIIMRTKEPVKMTAGKFFVVSLETFADIGNKVFAYFTVLKNMQE